MNTRTFRLLVCGLLASIVLVHAGVARAVDVPTEGRMLSHGTDGKEVDLPLRHTDVHGKVSGFIARVRVEQVFHNPYATPIEAVYVFPLPHEAAVGDMTIHIGTRTIRAQIQKRAEARARYDEARQAGKTAALLEQERPNIFTQSVANIMPGEQIRVEITYDQAVPYERGRYEIVFPMVVGPRYTGERTPDAAAITPPNLKPGERNGHDIAVEFELDPGVAIQDLKSPSHLVEVTPPKAGTGPIRVKLSDKDSIPNKDFVLTYAPAGAAPTLALLAHKADQHGHFALMFQPPAAPAPSGVTAKDVVFVLDTSGSMSGEPIAAVKQAMRHAIKNLGPRDSFRIVRFSNSASAMSEHSLANNRDNVRAALSYINGIDAGGGTEMLSGLREALADPPPDDRLRIICFMTDGYIGHEAEMLDAIDQEQSGNQRLFAFGVGSSVNRYLLDAMAEHGRGSAFYVLMDQKPEPQVEAFYARIDKPVLTHIEIDWQGLAVSEVTPPVVPDLFADQPMWVVGRFQRAGKATIRVRGRIAGKPVEYRIPVALPDKEPAHETMPQLWARARIKELASKLSGRNDQDLEQQITTLGLDYRLMTRFTSFVAIEEKVVNQDGTPTRVEVPLEMPHGVSYEGVYGGDEEVFVLSGSLIQRSESSSSGGSEALYLVSAGRAYRRGRWDVALGLGAGMLKLAADEDSEGFLGAHARVALGLGRRVAVGLELAMFAAQERSTLANLLVAGLFAPLPWLHLELGLGPAFGGDDGVGLGLLGGARADLFRLGPCRLGLELRVEGGVYPGDQDALAGSLGVSISF